MFSTASKSLTQIDLSGEGAPAATRGYSFAWYEPLFDRFLLKTDISDVVYTVDPETFAVERVVTSGGASLPNAMNGVHSRWQRLPKLGGYAYYPRYRSGVWFLASE